MALRVERLVTVAAAEALFVERHVVPRDRDELADAFLLAEQARHVFFLVALVAHQLAVLLIVAVCWSNSMYQGSPCCSLGT